MSTISEEDIQKALETFKSTYEKNKKQYEEKNVKIEDVINLTKGFSGKSAILATTVILSVMMAMPPKEFIALMDTAKSMSKIRLLEYMREIIKGKIEKGIDNDINN